MAEKTIMKLYPNGDLETIGVQLQQASSNLFIKENTESGYLSSDGSMSPTTEDGEKISEFIPVSEGDYIFRITWNHTAPTNISYCNIGYFDSDKNFLVRTYRFEEAGVANMEQVVTIPSGVAYIRISASYVDTIAQVVFTQAKSSYSFGRDRIIVPQIIQQPRYRNYFIAKDTVTGYLNGATGNVVPPNEEDRTSDFIDVTDWEFATIHIRYTNINGTYEDGYVGIYLYTNEKDYNTFAYDDYVRASTVNFVFTHQVAIPSEVGFIRVCTNYYDTDGVTVEISVEKGSTTDTGHVQAIEDMYEWATHTDNPISIFPEGIVIKGNLIQTSI